jgi:multidrug transporter EmrE-like cation transporter
MSWFCLILAGLLEVFVVKSIRDMVHKKYVTAIPLYIIAISSSLYLLFLAMREIDISIAYAVYTGMGVVGTVLMGMFLWGEQKSLEKAGYVGLILIGVVSLKLFN